MRAKPGGSERHSLVMSQMTIPDVNSPRLVTMQASVLAGILKPLAVCFSAISRKCIECFCFGFLKSRIKK